METYDFWLDKVRQDVDRCGYSLQRVPIKYKTYEICLEAIKSNGSALRFVPEEHKKYELCLEAMKNRGYYLYCVPEEHRTYELCMIAVKCNNYNFTYVPDEVKVMIVKILNTITPSQFITLPEYINKEELIDPLTLDKIEDSTIYAFFKEKEKYYIVTSLHQIQNMINIKFGHSTKDKVFVPTKNSLMNISELVWVKF
jgi:hypothetical protein